MYYTCMVRCVICRGISITFSILNGGKISYLRNVSIIRSIAIRTSAGETPFISIPVMPASLLLEPGNKGVSTSCIQPFGAIQTCLHGAPTGKVHTPLGLGTISIIITATGIVSISIIIAFCIPNLAISNVGSVYPLIPRQLWQGLVNLPSGSRYYWHLPHITFLSPYLQYRNFLWNSLRSISLCPRNLCFRHFCCLHHQASHIHGCQSYNCCQKHSQTSFLHHVPSLSFIITVQYPHRYDCYRCVFPRSAQQMYRPAESLPFIFIK